MANGMNPGCLVSCIMPTANRRRFLPEALRRFLAQDYPDRELVILDDGEDSVADLVPPDPRIRYLYSRPGQPLGAKRNLACEEARGDIIAHWDDDDWYAPDRLRHQVDALIAANADLCGLDRVLFLDPAAKRAWEYVYPPGYTPWVCGATLCYRKSQWRRTPFPEINLGEDTRFVANARDARIASLADNWIFVGLIHGANTSWKNTHDPSWRQRPLETIKAVLGRDWGRYVPQRAESPAANQPGSDIAASANRVSFTVTSREGRHARDRTKVSIGVHVGEGGTGLLTTVGSLEANSSLPIEILLLGDGPDASARRALAVLSRHPQLTTQKPLGAPACFNRLIREGSGEVLVFLESGAVAGPGCLELMIGALQADPRNGLAGPSTNRAWNMQAVSPNRAVHQRELGAISKTLLATYGHGYQMMEPLYCLGDFCYAVRRDVVDTIGAADEAYAQGPCWEMDYSIRAVRSGFRPVWVQGAYVWRMPASAGRQREEARRFEANKRRYQDKFCGKRLRRETLGYEVHCLGEECPHFAPPELVQPHLTVPLRSAPTRSPAAAAGSTPPSASAPRVSCIMPTGNRRSFLPLALTCFEAQDYPNKELIIVDDGQEPVSDMMEPKHNVRYLHLNQRRSIGHKRNLASECASGEILIHWDDDDWYGMQRISRQAEPIIAGVSDMSGLETRWILDLLHGQFWTISPLLHQRMFVGDIHGGTLAYARAVWDRGVRYPDASLAEDASFLQQALRLRMRLTRVPNEELFVYSRHDSNAWRFPVGGFLDAAAWREIAPPKALSCDLLASYQAAARQLLDVCNRRSD
jgi:glycosyltransferase involved in cell wall biosynthesis